MSSFTHSISSSLILQPLKIPKPSTSIFSSKPYRNFTLVVACDSQPKSRKPAMDGHKPTSKFRRKSSYGTSRRSILKKTFSQEQVTFTSALSDDPLVAIIGGGMAGIMCALSLEKRGVRSTVFDTGIHGLGGRMGTRSLGPEPLIFDHAAQFFTVTDAQFAQLVDGWLAAGLVKEWKGTVGELELGGRFVPMSSCPRYIGTNGMRPLADSLLSQISLINVIRPCWISKLEPFNGMWHLSENGKPQGHFDAIVIAHNGKCANRLLATSGLPLIAKQMKRLELSSIWALLAAFEDPLPIPDGAITFPFEGAFVKGVDSLSWMSNNNEKFLNFQKDGPHCWTFLSTAAYGKQNKVPQENIPTSTAEKVKKNMLEGVEAAMGFSKGSLPKPFYTRSSVMGRLRIPNRLTQMNHLDRLKNVVKRGGAALPTNTPGIPCIFDPHGRAGICGDWLLGSNIESAALSGMALGNHIADYFQSGGERSKNSQLVYIMSFSPFKDMILDSFQVWELKSRQKVHLHFSLPLEVVLAKLTKQRS